MSVPAKSIRRLRSELLGGDITSVGLIERACEAARDADRGGEPLNAFLSLADAPTFEAAEEIDKKLAAGIDPGPLAGIPIAIKDNISVAGRPLTCGSRILKDYIAPFDATVVNRLREAGAVIVGKANLDEFAMGSSNENSAFGPVRNPHDRSRVPGGSSGGSAAAVAAGFVPAALGSDTGGSIRQPAAFCGVVGLKPTYGRVSRYGLVAFASSLDHVGPITATVEDAASVLQVIAGADARDATSSVEPVPDYSRALDRGCEGLVIGVPRYLVSDVADVEVARACSLALDRMEAMGAEMREVSLPHFSAGSAAYYLMVTAEASSNLARFDGVRYGFRAPEAKTIDEVYRMSRGSGFGPEVKRRIVLGTFGLSTGHYDAYYSKGLGARELIAADFDAAFDSGIDLIFTPTSPTAAFRLGSRTSDPVRMYRSDFFTVPANLARVPAISVPIGTCGDGLPIGGQLLAGRFKEEVLLSVGRALESSVPASPLEES